MSTCKHLQVAVEVEVAAIPWQDEVAIESMGLVAKSLALRASRVMMMLELQLLVGWAHLLGIEPVAAEGLHCHALWACRSA